MNSPPLISSEIFFNNIISFDVSLFVLFLSNFVSFISLLSLFFISIKFCSFLLSNKISFNSYTSSFTLLSFLVLELFSVFSVILFLIPKVALSNLIIVLFLSSSSLFLYLFSLCSSPYKKFCNLSIDKILVIDNSEHKLSYKFPHNVEYYHSDDNWGIAKSLNYAAKKAIGKKYKWMMITL